MNMMTPIESRRPGVRRITGTAAVITALAMSLLLVEASSASTIKHDCYRKGAYSFRLTTSTVGSERRAELHVYRGVCRDHPILSGLTIYNTRTRHVTLVATDYKPDGTGVTIYTHGPSVSSRGVGSTTVGGGKLRRFAKPYHFWLRVGGTTNSEAHDLPIP